MRRPANSTLLSVPKWMTGAFFRKPCIQGTRMPVSSILSYLSGGMTTDELVKEFNWLTKDDVLEAIAFASNMNDFRTLPLKKVS